MQNVARSLANRLSAVLLGSAAAVAFAACGMNTADAQSRPTAAAVTNTSRESARHEVAITRVRVFVQRGRPHAYVEGDLGDGCASLAGITQRRAGNVVTMTFTARRDGETCRQQPRRLNAWVALDGPFTPGVYAVRANATTAHFRLLAHGRGELRLDPDPGPPPTFPEPLPPDVSCASAGRTGGSDARG
jgi:hypothetical protein